MKYLMISSALAFMLDQLSKLYVLFGLRMLPGDSIDVIPPLLRFRFGWNDGINFGLFSTGSDMMRWLLVGLALAIILFVLQWVWRHHRKPLPLLSAGLLMGGALGNVMDRIIYGAVVDFLNFSCCGIQNPFIINIADIFVFAGMFGLILFTSEKKHEKAQS